MGVALVADVEDEAVAAEVIDAVEGDREFDDAEVAGEVPAVPGDGLGDEGAHLRGEGVEFVLKLHYQPLQHLHIVPAGLSYVDDGKGACDGGGHLVTRGRLPALVRAVGIAGNNALCGELPDGVVGPVVQRNVHKRIDRRDRRSREGQHNCYCYQCQILSHI